jgi:hypothetical protein
MNVITLTSIDDLSSHLLELFAQKRATIVGIDGMDGIGKSTLANDVARRIDAKLISLDNYLDRKMGAYVAYLRCAELKVALMEESRMIIVEGVCLRAAAERCGFHVDAHIYALRLDKYGIWDDERICLAATPPEGLKTELQTFRNVLAGISSSDPAYIPDDQTLGLDGELIDYHAAYRPVERADVLFNITENRTTR